MKKLHFAIFAFILFVSCKREANPNQDIIIYSKNHKTMKLDSLYSDMYNYGEFNGNVLIADNDTIIFNKCYGVAEKENNVLLKENSVYNLASVTKQFTATAIVLLVKQGKLSLNDEMSKYIPELSFYEGITIDHLVRHTSGLADYMAIGRAAWGERVLW